MVIEQKQTHIAYRCPACSSAVTGIIGSFALSCDMLKLKCPCANSEMAITYSNSASTDRMQKKIKLSIPCAFCGKSHNNIISNSLFFQNDIFLLSCNYTGMDICFIGSPEKVSEEIKRSDEELTRLLNEYGISSSDEFVKLNGSADTDSIPDGEVYDIVRYLVADLKEDNAIHCPCDGGNYDFEFTPDGIKIYCLDCGAEYIFEAQSVAMAQEFLDCARLDLK